MQMMLQYGTLNVANANCANVKNVVSEMVTNNSGINPAASANAFHGQTAVKMLNGISTIANVLHEPTNTYFVK